MRFPLLIIILMPVLFSCKKSRDGQRRIDNDLLITIAEEKENEPQLWVKTEEWFECANFSIAHDVYRDGNSITVRFNYIQAFTICLTAFGPATATVSLGQLAPGKYSLVLYCNGNTHTLPLTVTTEKYVIGKTSGRFFRFRNAELNRMPENLLWYFADKGKLPASAQMAAALGDSLLHLGATAYTPPQGAYTLFTVTAGNKVMSGNRTYTTYKYTGDFGRIKKLMKGYYTRYKDSLYIGIENSKGQFAYSWLSNQ